MVPYVVAMVVLVGALLWAIRVEHPWLQWVVKPLASATFVAAALRSGLPESAYDRALVSGLVLAAIGDVLLIPQDRRAFLGGLTAFLLGHVLYGIAFVARGIHGEAAAMTGAVALVAALAVLRWLWPHARGAMRGPVLAYVTVITTMLALAVGTFGHSPDGRIPLGALAFYLSDLAVARERFVAPGFVNRAWGLPLYFASQLVLASTA